MLDLQLICIRPKYKPQLLPQRMTIISILLEMDNELKFLGTTGHSNGFRPHWKFRNMYSVNLTQFSIITAVTSLYHAYQWSLNPLNNILPELYSPNPPSGLHSFLGPRAGFSCQWEHGPDTGRQRLFSPPTSTLPSFYYQKEKKLQDFCLSLVIAVLQKSLFASYWGDTSSSHLLILISTP